MKCGGCEIWSLKLLEEHWLWNTVGPRREDVAEYWRKMLSEELCDLYCSPYIIKMPKSRRVILAGYVAVMWEMGNTYRI
jgi:hypothetical protein